MFTSLSEATQSNPPLPFSVSYNSQSANRASDLFYFLKILSPQV